MSSPLAALSLAVARSRRKLNPPPPLGPRGWRTTLLLVNSLSLIGLPLRPGADRDEGRLGTGGTADPAKELFPNKLPNPPGDRRDGEAMVAKPSRRLPLEARAVRRGACV